MAEIKWECSHSTLISNDTLTLKDVKVHLFYCVMIFQDDTETGVELKMSSQN